MSAIRDSSDDAPLFDLERRVHELETANPMESASIETGMTRVVSPEGASLAAIGHAAGRAGFLLPSGGGWVTVQEYVAQQLATIGGDLAYLNAQIATLNGRVDTVDQGLGVANGRIDNVDQRLGVANGRIDNVDVRAGNAATAAANAASAAAAAQATANGRVTQAQANAIIDFAVAVLDRFDAHMDQYHGGRNPGRPTPPAKG